MRILTKLLALAGITGSLVVAAASPSAAEPDPCPGGESICLYTAGGTFPLGNPVTLPPTGPGATAYPGPSLCDGSGSNCVHTYLIAPGAEVTSTATPLAEVVLHGMGVGIDGSGHATVYFTQPDVDVYGPPLGLTLTAYIPIQPVWLDPISRGCAPMPPSTTGPVTTSRSFSCILTVTIQL